MKGDRPPISLTNTRGNDLQEISKIMKEEITIENVKVLHNTIFKKLTTHPQWDGTRLRTLYINAKEDKTYFPSIKPYHPMQKTLQTRSKVMKVKRHYSKPFPRYIQASGSKCKNTSPRRPPTAKLSRIWSRWDVTTKWISQTITTLINIKLWKWALLPRSGKVTENCKKLQPVSCKAPGTDEYH